MCYSACSCCSLTHSRRHALNVWTEEKWSFCFCCRHCLVKQQQREQCDASNHIWYASHNILPTWHASREVPGTVEHPQSSLECMCHDGINPQPWLMLYIYNHSSQRCHHNSQKIWVSSSTVWAAPTHVCDYVEHPRGCQFFSPTMVSLVMAWEWNWSPCPFVPHRAFS